MTEHEHRGEFTIRDTPNPFEHPMQRRAVALDLAIKTYGGVELTHAQRDEVLNIAHMYEEYIRGPQPVKAEPETFDADGPEPPPGRYQDSDDLIGAYWERTDRGWRYYTYRGDLSGDYLPWDSVSRHAPFVRIGDLPAEGGEQDG